MPFDSRYPSSGLHGQVVHQIGHRIVSGEIPVGGFLPKEVELSVAYKASRPAIREAIKVLAAKGLVEPRRRRGTQVRPREAWNLLDPDVLSWHPVSAFPPDFLIDLQQLRRTVEPAAAELAAIYCDPRLLEPVAQALAEMRLADADPVAFYAADLKFHVSLMRASGNSLFANLSGTVRAVLAVSLRLQEHIGGPKADAHGMHHAVYAAVMAGNAERARRAMQYLIDDASMELQPLSRPGSRSGGDTTRAPAVG